MGKKGTGIGGNNGGMFGFTLSQQQATQKNLLGQVGGNAAKRVASDQAYAVKTFGGGLTGSVKKIFVGARAAAQQQAVTNVAGRETVKVMGRTLTQVGSIMDSGAKAQAAAYARAKALQVAEQSGASDSQTAAFAQQIFMAQMQHRWALQEAKAAQTAATGAASPHDAQQYSQGIINSTATVQPVIQEVVNAAIEENGGTYKGLPTTTIAAQAVNQLGYDATDPQAEYVQSIVRQAISQRVSIPNAVALAQDELFSGYAGYQHWGDKTAAAAQKVITATEARSAADQAEDPKNAPAAPFTQSQPGQTAQQLGLEDTGNGKYRDSVGNFYRYNAQSMSYVRI